MAKCARGDSWKTTQGSQGTLLNRHSESLKKGQLTLSQGMVKTGDDIAVDDDDDALKTSKSQYQVTAKLCRGIGTQDSAHTV